MNFQKIALYVAIGIVIWYIFFKKSNEQFSIDPYDTGIKSSFWKEANTKRTSRRHSNMSEIPDTMPPFGKLSTNPIAMDSDYQQGCDSCA